MKNRLFDFSAAGAAMTVLAYTLLFILFGYTYRHAEHPLFYGIIFWGLVVSALLMAFYFLFLSVRLTERSIRHGDKRIPRKDVSCTAKYDLRLKESVILIRNRTLDYAELGEKGRRRNTIRVQATRRNLQKLSAYLGVCVPAPAKPMRRRRR